MLLHLGLWYIWCQFLYTVGGEGAQIPLSQHHLLKTILSLFNCLGMLIENQLAINITSYIWTLNSQMSARPKCLIMSFKSFISFLIFCLDVLLLKWNIEVSNCYWIFYFICSFNSDSLWVMYLDTLLLKTFSISNSILSKIGINIEDLIWLLFVWYISSHHLIFNFFMSLNLKFLSRGQYIVGLCFSLNLFCYSKLFLNPFCQTLFIVEIFTLSVFM